MARQRAREGLPTQPMP